MHQILLLIACVLAGISDAGAQDAREEARRLRGRGELAPAVRLLDDHLRRYPDDIEAVRLKAETLYWLGELEQARTIYIGALTVRPDHDPLRIDYVRFLVETGDPTQAVRMLEAQRGLIGRSADAAALKGTALYWQGDLSGARRLFEQALMLEPDHANAARQLREIRMLTAPWIRLGSVFRHDDQPLERAALDVEAGWFVTPLLKLSVRSEPLRAWTPRDAEPTASMAAAASPLSGVLWQNQVELAHTAPVARLESRIAVGAVRRPPEHGTAWIGSGSLFFRPAAGVSIGARVDRTPYLNTVASLETAIVTTGFTAAFTLDRAGWLGEAVLRRERYPDTNVVRTKYVWALAPLVTRAAGALQAGYAIAASDSDENRFVLARPDQALPPSDPRFDFSGVYVPYYTPQRNVTQSILASVRLGRADAVALRAGGSYGWRAREDATVFAAPTGQLSSFVGRRSYRPWTMHAKLQIPASAKIVFNAGAESGETAFYRWTSARLDMTYRFLPPERGR